MKEIKRYVCDICGTEYKKKFDAKQCEDNHKACKTIVREFYSPLGVDKSGYPITIWIDMEDGKRVKYKRVTLEK